MFFDSLKGVFAEAKDKYQKLQEQELTGGEFFENVKTIASDAVDDTLKAGFTHLDDVSGPILESLNVGLENLGQSILRTSQGLGVNIAEEFIQANAKKAGLYGILVAAILPAQTLDIIAKKRRHTGRKKSRTNLGLIGGLVSYGAAMSFNLVPKSMPLFASVGALAGLAYDTDRGKNQGQFRQNATVNAVAGAVGAATYSFAERNYRMWLDPLSKFLGRGFPATTNLVSLGALGLGVAAASATHSILNRTSDTQRQWRTLNPGQVDIPTEQYGEKQPNGTVYTPADMRVSIYHKGTIKSSYNHRQVTENIF